jgi:hypothetical protein
MGLYYENLSSQEKEVALKFCCEFYTLFYREKIPLVSKVNNSVKSKSNFA